MLTSSGGGRSMLTGGRGGIKFAKILLTSYVNAPYTRDLRAHSAHAGAKIGYERASGWIASKHVSSSN